jgi:hypothetical protein
MATLPIADTTEDSGGPSCTWHNVNTVIGTVRLPRRPTIIDANTATLSNVDTSNREDTFDHLQHNPGLYTRHERPSGLNLGVLDPLAWKSLINQAVSQYTRDQGRFRRNLGVLDLAAWQSLIDKVVSHYTRDAGPSRPNLGVIDSAVWQSPVDKTFLEEQPNESGFSLLTKSMTKSRLPLSWCVNPRLYCILYKMERLDLFDKVLSAGTTDQWLPLHRRTVRRWLTDHEDVKSFMKFHDRCLDDNIPVDLHGRHFSVTDFAELGLTRVKFLGEGGFGEVHQVKSQHNEQKYACKTMLRPVRHDIHVILMNNFKRELFGMRRVRHRHCVDLVASCTDTDSVNLISSPVADMDLSKLLNPNLSKSPADILWCAIGCITSALAYLHKLHIR